MSQSPSSAPASRASGTPAPMRKLSLLAGKPLPSPPLTAEQIAVQTVPKDAGTKRRERKDEGNEGIDARHTCNELR